MQSREASPTSMDHPQDASYPDSMRNAVGPQPSARSPHISPYSETTALCPLGAFHSGMGGLSIVAELRRTLPYEEILFYADTVNCPYGVRSDEWLRTRALEITDFLLERGAKGIVVACNTASAAGLEHLRVVRQVPIVGLVPAVKPAVAATRTGVIGVLATKGAMRGRLLHDVIERFAHPADVEVVTVAPTGLVEAVERGDLHTQETREAISQALAPIIEQGADTIVLGCTHFPFLQSIIREVAGNNVQLIDSGQGVARQTSRVLQSRHLLHPTGKPGALTVYTSGSPDAVRPVVWRLLGEEVPVLQG